MLIKIFYSYTKKYSLSGPWYYMHFNKGHILDFRIVDQIHLAKFDVKN